MENINMSDAKSHFSEFISRAANGERFVILRREHPLAAIIGAGDLARLERSAVIAHRLAQALGQSKKLLESIEAGKVHPAMAAYGLWKDEDDLTDLNETVKKDRRHPSSRPKIEL
jgi:antitoxin (DNA-binding transcriptional repressor) of toxin-antitoxin stability system